MKLRILILQLFLLFPLFCTAAETDEQTKQLIDEALEVTGALKIGKQMAAAFVAEMTRALKAADDALPDRAYEIMESEVNRVISEEMASGKFNELMYPIYSKYLTTTELEAMVAFYKTKEGKKIASVLPQMSQDGMIAGQRWGASLGPVIVARMKERLAEEGIEFP